MALIGPDTCNLIIERITRPLVIVDSIYAYLYKPREGSTLPSVGIHITSDTGRSDTIVAKLVKRATDEISEMHRAESAGHGPQVLRWLHTGPMERRPGSAQVIFVRARPVIMPSSFNA